MAADGKSVLDITPVDGSIFIDNLTICSADRLLSARYSHLKDDILDDPEIALTLFSHDLLNLSLLVESVVCHDAIYVNAEYIDRWNAGIQEGTLRPLADVVTYVSWPEEQRYETESELRKVLPRISADLGLSEFAEVVFSATHNVFRYYDKGRRLERQLFLPYDEGSRPWGTPFYIVMGTGFYLMCSQVIGIPYKPSILRARLLPEMLRRDRTSRALNATEIAISFLETKRQEIAEEYFESILERNFVQVRIPCVLSAVLKESKYAPDILRVAMEIRESDEAKGFREWSREFSETIQKGDLAEIGEFLRELEQLTERVNKRLGLESSDELDVSLGWGPIEIGRSFSLPKFLNRPISLRRHLCFLHGMYSDIATMARVSDHVDRVITSYLPGWFRQVVAGRKVNWHSTERMWK